MAQGELPSAEEARCRFCSPTFRYNERCRAGLIAAGSALRAVIRRARTGADPDTVAADDALRQRAARTITSACGILVTVPLAGTCLVSAGALLSFSCRPAWWTYAGWALLALLIPVTGPGRLVRRRAAGPGPRGRHRAVS